MGRERLSVLLLGDDDRAHAGNLLEHLDALRSFSRNRVRLFNPRGVPASRFLDLNEFDVVVVHYSLVLTSPNYVAPWLIERIREFEGLKVQFLQDEYRWVDAVTEMMRHVGIDVLFSIVPPREIEAVYGGRLPSVEIVPTLAGFVPDALARRSRPPVPIGRRPVDVGYRGRVLPYWLGALSQEKMAIARGFLAHARPYGLRCDIAWSEQDRLYGERWVRFLESCRTTLGTESGASITDFDGTVERETLAYLERRPDAPFEEIAAEVLQPYEGNVLMNVISPRIFEAAALRTGLVLFPGEYGGVVEPDRHYLRLEKDFSNMEEVVEGIRDVRALEERVERTYEEVVASGRFSLRTFVAEFDDVIERRAERRATRGSRGYLLARAERPVVTRTVRGYDLREARERRRRRQVALSLVRESAALRRLARTLVDDADLRRRAGVTRALEDFLRLGLLLREHTGRPITTERFRIEARLDDPSTLTFAGRPVDSAPGTLIAHADGLKRLRDVSVPTLLWDHTAVGPLVFLRGRRTNIGLQVGYYRFIGVHHFGALEVIAEKHRELVIEALDPLLSQPPVAPASTPAAVEEENEENEAASAEPFPHDVEVDQTGGRADHTPRAGDTVDPAPSPVGQRRKTGELVLRAARRRAARRVLWRALARRDVSLQAALADLARVQALHDAWSGEISNVGSIEARASSDGTLLLTTEVDRVAYRQPLPALSESPLQEIVWDNSAVGPLLEIRGGTFLVAPDGLHRFSVLADLAASCPEVVRATLAPPAARAKRKARSARLRLVTVVLSALAARPGRAALALTLRRGRGPSRELIADLVKLTALDAAMRGRLDGVAGVVTRREDDALVFQSCGADSAVSPSPVLDRLPESIVWDHSAVGGPVYYQGVTLSLGADCRHEFGALKHLLRGADASAWHSLLPQLTADHQEPEPTSTPTHAR